MKYVLDTSVFNQLLDGLISLSDLPPNAEFVATHIQIDELKATKNQQRRTSLLAVFTSIAPEVVPTESGVWDVSRWGEFKWGDGVSYGQIKVALDVANNCKKNNIQDALIGEVAFKNGYGLITSDNDLHLVMTKFNVNVISLKK